jgi:UDP-GlcNAc:undecaprenyl-phosphate GlcNAc-1-phosphate transferase
MDINLIYTIIVAGLIAFGVGLYIVPLFAKAAIKHNIVDNPDGKVKIHSKSIPYLGGLAIYMAVVVSLAFTIYLDKRLTGLLLVGTIIVLIGLIDDFMKLTPLQKLIGQVLAVTIAIRSGIYIQRTAIPYIFHVPLTYLWVLATINAFNLLDGIDGQATSISIIATGTFLFFAIINNDPGLMVFCTALLFSLFAFLIYNSFPASIFMGDTGSMFLGLTIGVLSITTEYSGVTKFSLLAPLLILSLPFFNVTYVIFIRLINGVPIARATLDQWHDNLKRIGFNTPQIVLISSVFSLLFSILGIILVYTNLLYSIIILSIATIILLIIFTIFASLKNKELPELNNLSSPSQLADD